MRQGTKIPWRMNVVLVAVTAGRRAGGVARAVRAGVADRHLAHLPDRALGFEHRPREDRVQAGGRAAVGCPWSSRRVAVHWTDQASGKVWTVPCSGCSGALRWSVICRLTLIADPAGVVGADGGARTGCCADWRSTSSTLTTAPRRPRWPPLPGSPLITLNLIDDTEFAGKPLASGEPTVNTRRGLRRRVAGRERQGRSVGAVRRGARVVRRHQRSPRAGRLPSAAGIRPRPGGGRTGPAARAVVSGTRRPRRCVDVGTCGRRLGS